MVPGELCAASLPREKIKLQENVIHFPARYFFCHRDHRDHGEKSFVTSVSSVTSVANLFCSGLPGPGEKNF